MPTISQSLTLPGNVVAGGTIQPTDVSTLYNTLNAFNLPASLVPFQQAAGGVSDAATVLSTASASVDTAITSVAAAKTLIHLGAFSWISTTTALGNPQVTFRMNATAVSTAVTLTASSTSGSGVFLLFHGPRDGTVVAPTVGWVGFSGTNGNGTATFSASTGVGAAAVTSLGVSVAYSSAASTGTTFSVGHVRIWQEP